MKYLLLTTLATLFLLTAKAQNEGAIGTPTMTQEEAIALMDKGYKAFENHQYTTTIDCLLKCLASGHADDEDRGIFAFFLCDSYYSLADSTEVGTLEHHNQLLESRKWLERIIWKEFKDVDQATMKANVYEQLAISCNQLSINSTDLDEKIAYDRLAIDVFGKIKDRSEQHKHNMFVAKSVLLEDLYQHSDFDEALALGLRMEKEYDNISIPIIEITKLYLHIAFIYAAKEDHPKSGLYANKVRFIYNDKGEDNLSEDELQHLSMAYYLMSLCYESFGNMTCLEYAIHANRLIKTNDAAYLSTEHLDILLLLSDLYERINDYQSMIDVSAEALDIATKTVGEESKRGVAAAIACMKACTNVGEDETALNFIIGTCNILNKAIKDEVEGKAATPGWTLDDKIRQFKLVYGAFANIAYKNKDINLNDMISQIDAIDPQQEDKDFNRIRCSLYYDLGEYQKALNIGFKSMNNDVTNESADQYVYNIMVDCCERLGYESMKYTLLNSLLHSDRRSLKKDFANITAQMRENYWDKAERNFESTINFALRSNDKRCYKLAYDASLCRKGVMLAAEESLQKIVKHSKDTTLQRMYGDLQTLRRQRNECALRGETNAANWLAIEAETMEAEVLRHANREDNVMKMLELTSDDVRKRLKKDEAAIEFERFRDKQDAIRYVALVVRGNSKEVERIILFSEEELNEIRNREPYTTDALSSRLWRPLLPALEGVKNVYFAPDGELYNIAIESLPWIDGKGFMADHFSLFRVSSTRQLAEKAYRPGNNGVAYGGLDYALSDSEMAQDAREYGAVEASEEGNLLAEEGGMAGGTMRSVDRDAIREAVASIAPLPATLKEVEEISSVVKATGKGFDFKVLTGAKGTEASFKALSGKGLRIIHVATHGFFNSDDEGEALLQDTLLHHTTLTGEDRALTRSGLLLAGAENGLQDDALPVGTDDGILTAQEIAMLDFEGLDLIALSACQTGQGVVTGDGVFGLQRGFKKAGANSILMSLWKVDDDATSMLMSEFYRNWITGRMPKREALESAKQTIRSHEKWSDPMYWAAFILLDAVEN